MENKDMPAMPLIDEHSTHEVEVYAGLTKREHFAVMALQGLLSKNMPSVSIYEKSEMAAKYADALLSELAE